MEDVKLTLVDLISKLAKEDTLYGPQNPQELLDRINALPGAPAETNPFMVTANEALNDMAPVEVLAGKRFQVAEDDPVQVGYGSKGAVIIPFSETDQRAQARLLNYKVEERVIRVLYAARDYYDVLGD
jgi:hypothetical protein